MLKKQRQAYKCSVMVPKEVVTLRFTLRPFPIQWHRHAKNSPSRLLE